MEVRPSPELDFFPSTLEHRPLHHPEKVALKQYFESTGADEHEGFTPSAYAVTPALADFEAWVWGMRLWGRECTVRGTVAVVQLLADAWEAATVAGESDDVLLATAYSSVLTPAEAASAANYWANIPSEEKAQRIMELERALPAQWLEEPMHGRLQGKPFFWGALAAWRLMQGILLKRDPAAVGLAEACCGAARMRMLAGETDVEAVAFVRGRMVLALRAWMGYKW